MISKLLDANQKEEFVDMLISMSDKDMCDYIKANGKSNSNVFSLTNCFVDDFQRYFDDEQQSTAPDIL